MLQYTQITNLISELLYKHDCVIVPNFGGFVARQQSSNFSKGNNMLFPQAKHVLFNKNLLHNDGLLITALMEKTQLDYSEAEKLINDYRLYIQSLLNVKKRFELQNIGLLYMDSENSMRFEAKTDVNFLLDSFGFEPIVTNELVITPEKPVFEKQFEDRKANLETVIPIARKKRSYAKIAALAIGIPATLTMLLMAAYSKPMQPILQSSFNPFYSPEKLYKPAELNNTKAFVIEKITPSDLLADANGYASFKLSENGNVITASLVDSTAAADKTAVSKPLIAKNSKSVTSGKYQVVVGCFSVEENAERLVKDLITKHFNAGVSGTNAKGLHVVSCGSFDDKAEAAKLLDSIKAEFPSAWVMGK